MESHLLQMRGLKPIFIGLGYARLVASFTDAWIETTMRPVIVFAILSHLLQMRGLKPQVFSHKQHLEKVASFTDAWIETSASAFNPMAYLSHLLQMRGLKPLLII